MTSNYFRNQTDINIVIDNLLRKTEFHDKVSINFNRCTKSLKEIIFSLVEVLNINYDLIKQDEKDRESIALMGLTQNTHTIDYKKDSKIPPITLDKNCLSCSGRTTVILKAFKAACLSYSPSTVKYKGGTYTRDNLLGCIWEVITQLKSKLRDRNTLKSELPPIDWEFAPRSIAEISKNVSPDKQDHMIPWPKIDGSLPIQSPDSVSPNNFSRSKPGFEPHIIGRFRRWV